MKKILLFILMVIIISGCTNIINPQKIYISESYDTIHNAFSSSRYTDLQKDELFNEYKGKYVKWEGKVKNIDELELKVLFKEGIIFDDYVIVNMNYNQRSKLVKLNKGDSVIFSGRFSKRIGTLLYFDDGELLDSLSSSPNTEQQNTNKNLETKDLSQSQISSPSEVASNYFKEFISIYPDVQIMYDLLSDPKKPSNFDQWSDGINNQNNAYLMNGITFDFIGANDEQINDDSAIIKIKYKRNYMGYSTTTDTQCELIKEGGAWRLIKGCQP